MLCTRIIFTNVKSEQLAGLADCITANHRKCKFYGDEDIEPSHKITYTSTGGKVEPYNDDFGADIRSNKTEGNQGVIRFWGPVTKIGDNAFYGCSQLEYVRYNGNEQMWLEIDILEGNDNLLNAYLECVN